MRQLLRKLVSNYWTTGPGRAARKAPRCAVLQLEDLEDRTVPSTASLVGSTLLVNADPGSISVIHQNGIIGIIPHIRQITFQADSVQQGKLDVLDNGTLLGRFATSSVKNVDVSVAGLDAVNIDDSNGLPFAAGTTISLFGSGGTNSLNLTGSRTIAGGETYDAGSGPRAGVLFVGGSTFEFSNVIGSVTDQVKTTGSLVVEAFGQNVSLNGQDGLTQTLTGLADGGGGGNTFAYSNKNLVNLEMFSANASANLNATAAAAGEQFFVVDLFGSNEACQINATPSTVSTNVVAAGQGDAVFVAANSGRVSVNGTSSTLAVLGTGFGQTGVTSGIKQDVFVEGVGRLALTDPGNHTTQEHVTVTESTISGTGLFGNNAAVVHYNDIGSVQIVTGELADTYAIAGSKPGARFSSPIEIDDNSAVGLNIAVTLDAGSGLDLDLNNTNFRPNPAPASLFISAVDGTFSHPTPPLPTGIEDVTFAGGLTSEVIYSGFTSVTHS
jgi:hypothetical protein